MPAAAPRRPQARRETKTIGSAANFRADAAWAAHLAGLEAYRHAHGDCNVPQRWAADPGLARWAGNQRQCKKRLDRGVVR